MASFKGKLILPFKGSHHRDLELSVSGELSSRRSGAGHGCELVEPR